MWPAPKIAAQSHLRPHTLRAVCRDGWDTILIALSILMSIINGLTQPVSAVLFGALTEAAAQAFIVTHGHAPTLGGPTDGREMTSLQAGASALASRSALRSVSSTRHAEPVMAKKVSKMIKLALAAGSANPAPPVGPALGAAGVNIMMFCKEYNARTSDKKGEIIPVEISVFEDRSFTFILKTPPASELLKKAAGIKKGSGIPKGRGATTAGSVTMAQVEEIAKIKMPDLNTNKLQSCMNTVMGTAANMGITVTD